MIAELVNILAKLFSDSRFRQEKGFAGMRIPEKALNIRFIPVILSKEGDFGSSKMKSAPIP